MDMSLYITWWTQISSDMHFYSGLKLSYLNEWEDSVCKRKGEFSKTERNKMLLSAEQVQAANQHNNYIAYLFRYLAVRSLIDMVKYLFAQPTIKSFLSEKISQDPLEKFFGIQRQRGRVNENPNVREFFPKYASTQGN